MDMNSEAGQKPENPPENEAETISSLSNEALKGVDRQAILESDSIDLNPLLGLEELYPGFLDLVLNRMPEIGTKPLNSYLIAVMQEVATELGQEKLAKMAARSAVSESGKVDADPKSLMRLEKMSPGFINLFFVKIQEEQEIQQQVSQRKLDMTLQPARRKLGRTITQIFKKRT